VLFLACFSYRHGWVFREPAVAGLQLLYHIIYYTRSVAYISKERRNVVVSMVDVHLHVMLLPDQPQNVLRLPSPRGSRTHGDCGAGPVGALRSIRCLSTYYSLTEVGG